MRVVADVAAEAAALVGAAQHEVDDLRPVEVVERAELEKLRPGSKTNLWGGLELGLDKLVTVGKARRKLDADAVLRGDVGARAFASATFTCIASYSRRAVYALMGGSAHDNPQQRNSLNLLCYLALLR